MIWADRAENCTIRSGLERLNRVLSKGITSKCMLHNLLRE